MKSRYLTIILIFGLLVFLLPGCVFISRDFRMTRNEILKEIGDVDIDTEVQLQIGPGLLSIGKMVASCTEIDDEAKEYLRDIHNVQVGVYKLRNVKKSRISIPKRIAKRLERKGYEPMVKVKERNEATWVMTKMKGNKLRSLYVIALDREELVLVEVEGRLGKIVEKAIQEHGIKKGTFAGL